MKGPERFFISGSSYEIIGSAKDYPTYDKCSSEKKIIADDSNEIKTWGFIYFKNNLCIWEYKKVSTNTIKHGATGVGI